MQHAFRWGEPKADETMTPGEVSPVVQADDLHVTFERGARTVYAVNGVDFSLERGEVLTILGESGSGKSVTLRALMGILPRHARVRGRVSVRSRDLYALGEKARSALRGPEISMIFQEPATSLDPVFTIGDQIVEMILAHERIDRAAARARALELLQMVAIPGAARRLKSYPHELSGGMRQRAMIAIALACRPSVLLADEPTTALDVSVQVQVLVLLRELQQALGMAVVFVTHDVGVAAEISDRVAVMYAGRLVETGTAAQVLTNRRHPYTRGLLSSTVSGVMRGQPLEAIGGQPPDLASLPPGCAFAPRCAVAAERCRTGVPAMVTLSPGRGVRCIHAQEEAPAGPPVT